MTTPTNTFNDPQSVIALSLRPPDGFEGLYQGLARSTPLPFVASAGFPQDQYLPKDPRAGQPEMSARLLRYVTTPIGATMQIVIPRALYVTGGETPAEGAYTYELRWRLRTVTDHNVAQDQRSDPTVPYTLIPRRGAPDASDNPLTVLPAYTSEAVVPSVSGLNNQLPVIDSATEPRGVANQGTYIPATVGGFGTAFGPSVYFSPLLRRVLGNELSIVAYRAAGNTTWDFTGDDGGMSNLYGQNLVTGGTRHAIFPGIGLYLVFLAGSPAL